MKRKGKTRSKAKKISKQTVSSKEAIKHLKYQGTIQMPRKVIVNPQSVLHKHKESWGDYILKNVESTTKKDKWGLYELESIPASKEVPYDLHKKAVDIYVKLEEHLVREVIRREGQPDLWLGESGWDFTAMFYDPEENNVNFEFTYYMDTWRTLEVKVYLDRYEVKISVHIDKEETESGKVANFTPYHRKNIKKDSTVVKSINENMYVDWAASK